MTANLVTGFSPNMDMKPQATAGKSSTSQTDFSEVLKTSTASNKSSSKGDGNELESVKTEQTKANAKETSSLGNEKSNQSESVNKIDNGKKPEVKEESAAGKQELSDKDVETAMEAINSMLQEVATILNVSVEQVEEAMDSLGLEKLEILDTNIIPKLTAEINGAIDIMEIMVNEELSADVKELMATSEDVLNQLAKDLDIPVEELKNKLGEQVTIIKEEKTDASLIMEESDGGKLLEEIKVETNVQSLNEKDRESKSGERENSSKNETPFSFTQTVADTLKNAVDKVSSEMPMSYVRESEMSNILNQVRDSLKTTMNEEVTEMEMQLHPASLGNVKVQVAVREGVITANFTTQDEQVRQALESQVVALKEQMNEQGIKVEAIEVTVSSHAFERNLNEEGESRSSDDGREGKTRKPRSINLDTLEAGDLMEIEEADRVTADMMAREGNSVDYLA